MSVIAATTVVMLASIELEVARQRLDDCLFGVARGLARSSLYVEVIADIAITVCTPLLIDADRFDGGGDSGRLEAYARSVVTREVVWLRRPADHSTGH